MEHVIEKVKRRAYDARVRRERCARNEPVKGRTEAEGQGQERARHTRERIVSAGLELFGTEADRPTSSGGILPSPPADELDSSM